MKTVIKKGELAVVFVLLCFFSFQLVKAIPRFASDYSFVVYDRDGNLLNAQVSADEQWRFPPHETSNKMYTNAAVLYEDKNFYFHCGVDPFAVLRALVLNIKHKKIISGASTLTMQVARIAEKNKARSFPQKIRESFLSVLLEICYPKETILQLYANNAPYGGNVVGIDAASWRYFSRSQKNLSVAELAALAVLPNEPSLVRPGLNETILQTKRDALLEELFTQRLISAETLELAKAEAVPTAPHPLPNTTPHYAAFLKKQSSKNFALTAINPKLQERCSEIMERLSADAARSGVYNAAAIIIENKSGNIIAYIGNTGVHNKNRIVQNEAVDMLQARRSSGSLLKPFLYAAALDASLILPTQILPDLPTQFASYIPQNNSHYFLGAVPANEALTKSLNVPFVNLLADYSIENFLPLLQRLGFSTFDKSAEYYGLPLILGGGELTLYEITSVFRNMVLCAYGNSENLPPDFPISEASARITLDVLQSGVRPADEKAWNYFSSSKKIAWKTGTSYGNKDAWCVGVSPAYTVGVWFGNANGVGRPEITSSHLAAPALFKLFELLPNVAVPPRNEINYKTIPLCKHSGFAAGEFCDEKTEIQIPRNFHINKVCPYCRAVVLTANEKFRVSNIAATHEKTCIKNFFILPPAQEYYYSQAHPDYQKLPPQLAAGKINSRDFQIIFPKNYSNIFIPTQLDGSMGAFTAKAAYGEKHKELFWFLDKNFLCTTETIHEVKITASYGRHTLSVVDSTGNEESLVFFVLSK